MHTVGPGIWREKWKTWKLRNAHCKTWIMVWNSEKRSKLEMNTVWPGIWPKTLKNVENEKRTLSDLDYHVKHWKSFKMRNAHSLTWNMAKNTEKHGPWEIHTVGPGIWKKWKSWKMSNAHFMTWNMARGTEKLWKWELHTIGPGSWGETWKICKMKHKHCMTWNIQEILKNVEKEKCSLWDLEYDEKTETHGNEKWAL